MATSQSLLQLTKDQINDYLEKANCGYSTKVTAANKGQMNGYLEKAKCGHSTKCAPGNDGHTAGQVPGQAKERFAGSRQQDPWLLQRIKNLSFVGCAIHYITQAEILLSSKTNASFFTLEYMRPIQ